MINNIPFFRFPFYPYPRRYPQNYDNKINISNESNTSIHNALNDAQIKEHGNTSHNTSKKIEDKKSSTYSSIGPISFNFNGFSNKEEPLLMLSGLKLYLDDFIILSLLFFLYKEDVKDDMLFMILILLLIT